MTKAKQDWNEQIKKADQELESISTNINELATRQQRLIGYRQCLVDLSETYAVVKADNPKPKE